MKNKYTYKGCNLKKITQAELAKHLSLYPILVSTEPTLSYEDVRIAELFAFAENYDLFDLLEQLKTIYP